ncbi:MAG: glycosyltransferase family 4 protein [Bryobacterales bacterium]|nr:glycosyltransferase family 4 protein [Bryobacterales bacterium]
MRTGRAASAGGRRGVIIGLDTTPLAQVAGGLPPRGGIARYTERLRDALRREFPGDTVMELTDQGAALGLFRRRWWSIGLPLALRQRGAHVFHGPDFSVPYLPVCPSVVTIHDTSPWRTEYQAATSPRVRRRTPWLVSLGMAALVVTPTEAVRREVLERFRLHESRVRVTPLGVSVQPTGEAKEDFALVVGSGLRKNIERAREAAEALAPLRVVNHDVSDHELASLYTRARVLLLPSHYEGFGLPAIEAMACGTPVIASTDAALREVCGGAALHVDASDAPGWREAFTAVWRQPDRARAMAEAGLRRAATFTWERTARDTHAVYEEAVRLHA